MPTMFFVSDATGRKYRVRQLNKESGEITLEDDHGSPFVEKYSKERFEKLGYRLIQE